MTGLTHQGVCVVSAMNDIVEDEMETAVGRMAVRNAHQSTMLKPSGESKHSISYPVLSRIIEVYTERCCANATTTAAMNALLAHLGIPRLESGTADRDQEYFVSVVLKGLLAGIMMQIMCQGFAVWTIAPPSKKDLRGADGSDRQSMFPVPVLVDTSSHDFYVVVDTETRAKHMVGFRKDVMGGMHNSSGGESTMAALPTFMGSGGGSGGGGPAGSNRKPDPRLHFYIHKWPSRRGEPQCNMSSVWESFVHCDRLAAADMRAADMRATPVTFLEASTAGDQQAVRSEMLGGLDEVELYRQARAQRNVTALATNAMADLQTTMHHRAGTMGTTPGLAEATTGLIPIPPMYKVSSVAPKVEQPKNMLDVLRRCQEDISAVFGVPASLLTQRTGSGGRAQSSDIEKVTMQMRSAVAEMEGWMVPILSRMFASTVVAAREEAHRTIRAKAVAAGSAVYLSTGCAINTYNTRVRKMVTARARARAVKKEDDDDEEEDDIPEEIAEEAAIATKETRAKMAMNTARDRLKELATGEFLITFPDAEKSSQVGVEKETREREHLAKMEGLRHKHAMEELKLKLQMEAQMKDAEFRHAERMAATAAKAEAVTAAPAKAAPAKAAKTTGAGAGAGAGTGAGAGAGDDRPKQVPSDLAEAEGVKKRVKVPGGDRSPAAGRKRVRTS